MNSKNEKLIRYLLWNEHISNVWINISRYFNPEFKYGSSDPFIVYNAQWNIQRPIADALLPLLRSISSKDIGTSKNKF